MTVAYGGLVQVVGIKSRWLKFVFFLCVCMVLRCPTSKISSRDTSMRQCPACGCCWESSCRRIFSFCTRSLLYLGTVRHSASSGRFPGDSTVWACSFSWPTRLYTQTGTTSWLIEIIRYRYLHLLNTTCTQTYIQLIIWQLLDLNLTHISQIAQLEITSNASKR